jgi:predicted nucleotidyltransferase
LSGYLYGSLPTGDFDPGISDIDLLAVTSADMNDTEFEGLRRTHMYFARDYPQWDDRIDVVYVSASALKDFRSARSLIVISPGEPFHVREDEPLKDWLMNWYGVREWGLTLFGPAAIEIIPRITKDEFVQAIREYATYINQWVKRGQHRKGQAYAILTMCRALYAHRYGENVSKKQAVLWAQQELPEWAGLIENALKWRTEWREKDRDDAVTQAETVRFVQFVRGAIVV